MAWQEITNADGGKFESSPGSPTLNGQFGGNSAYYADWDLWKGRASSGGLLSDDDDAFAGTRSLYFPYANTGFTTGNENLLFNFKFPAIEGKVYRIRAYINPILTNEASVVLTFPSGARPSFPISKKGKLIYRLDHFPAIGADPVLEGYQGANVSKPQKSLSDITPGNWAELSHQVRATTNGPVEFGLFHFYNGTDFNVNDFENAFFNFDKVEFFEHDLITVTPSFTPATYKGANNAIASVNVQGGSGSFTITWTRNGSTVYQESVLEADEISDFNVENLAPGTYNFQIVDNELGYVETGSIVIAETASNLQLIVNKSNVSTAGVEDGSILLTATGDSGEYTFSISPQLGTQVSPAERTNLPAGTYVGTVTDNNNAEVRSAQIIINAPDSNLTLSLTKKDVTIPGLANGQITANAFGDSGEYAFSISPQTAQQQGNVFTGLVAGVYSVTVTDINSDAEVTQQITIIQPAELVLTETRKVNNLCFEDQMGEVDISITGGTPPYSYLWNNGSTTKNRVNLSTGTHIVRVTDSVNYSRQFNIQISSPPILLINIIKNGQDVTVQATGGVAPYTYLWSDGSTESQRTLPIGNYVVAVTDANRCTKNATIEVTDFKFYFSKNPIWLQKTTDPAGKLNLSYDAVLKVEKDYNSGNYETIFEANQPALPDGSTVFNFEEILKAQVKASLPPFAGKDPYIMLSNFLRFFVETNETYGQPAVQQSSTISETFHVVNGGLSMEDFADGEFFSTFIDQNFTPFLSWEPIAKTVFQDQPEYIAFPVIKDSIVTIALQAKYYDIAGTLLGTKFGENIGGLQPFMIVNFPVGYQQLGLNVLPDNDKIAYYEVNLVNANTQVISETKTYYLNRSTQSRKYFIYENALGVWATMVASGSSVGALEVDMEMVKVPKLIGYEPSQRGEKQVNKVLEQVYSYQAGNLLPEETFFLADFIGSEEVFEVSNKRFRPVSITMDSDWFNTFDDSTPFEFSVKYEADRNWTPDVFRVDNRRITSDTETEQRDALGILSDYGFESSYPEWGLGSANDNRITRSTADFNSGTASARYNMATYQHPKNAEGVNVVPSFSNAMLLMVFNITSVIESNRRHLISLRVKSSTDVSSTSQFRLQFSLFYKVEGETTYRNIGAAPLSSPSFQDSPKLKGFTVNDYYWMKGSGVTISAGTWKEIRQELSVLNKLKDKDGLNIVEYAIGITGIGALVNNLEVFMDDFAITKQAL